MVKCCIDEEWSYKKGQETAENPTKDEEKANLINYLKDRIREMRLSLDDMNNKLNDDKGNAEVKKNDKPPKKSLAETKEESSVIDDPKEVPKKIDGFLNRQRSHSVMLRGGHEVRTSTQQQFSSPDHTVIMDKNQVIVRPSRALLHAANNSPNGGLSNLRRGGPRVIIFIKYPLTYLASF